MVFERLDLHMDPNRKIPNALMFQALKASKWLLGEDGFKAIINRAEVISPGIKRYLDENKWPSENLEVGSPARYYSALSQAIEEVGAGRAQLMNIGIKTAKMGAADLGATMKAQIAILKRPPGFKWRAEKILKAMVDDLLDTIPGDRELNVIYMEIDDEKKVMRLIDRTGDTCHGRTGAKKPVCYIYRGGIVGTVELGTGYIPQVEEVMCMACGDPACVFEIDFEPARKSSKM